MREQKDNTQTPTVPDGKMEKQMNAIAAYFENNEPTHVVSHLNMLFDLSLMSEQFTKLTPETRSNLFAYNTELIELIKELNPDA